MLFLDLDDFKPINDHFGHDAGDRLLTAVAERIRACVRPEDTVARLGGDEFTVLLEDIVDVRYAIAVAERIEEALHEPFPIDGHEATVTASIGIAVSSGRDATPEDLMRDSDQAMYLAKRKGRARHEVFAAGTATEGSAPEPSRGRASSSRRGAPPRPRRGVIEQPRRLPLVEGWRRGADGARVTPAPELASTSRARRAGARHGTSRGTLRRATTRSAPQAAALDEARRRRRPRSPTRLTHRPETAAPPDELPTRAPPRSPRRAAGGACGSRRAASAGARTRARRRSAPPSDGWVANRNWYAAGGSGSRQVRAARACAPAR